MLAWRSLPVGWLGEQLHWHRAHVSAGGINMPGICAWEANGWIHEYSHVPFTTARGECPNEDVYIRAAGKRCCAGVANQS
jgi:hypothetical protein